MRTDALMSLEGATSIVKEMHATFGEKFVRQWASIQRNDLIETTRRVLAGLTVGEVNRGLQTMYGKIFPPTLSEFRAWCTQGSGNFADVDLAYVNAANEQYPDAATYEAARRTGFFEIRSRAESTTKPVFKKHYEGVCEELIANPAAFTLPESRRIAAAAPQFVKRDAAFFAQLKKSLGMPQLGARGV